MQRATIGAAGLLLRGSRRVGRNAQRVCSRGSPGVIGSTTPRSSPFCVQQQQQQQQMRCFSSPTSKSIPEVLGLEELRDRQEKLVDEIRDLELQERSGEVVGLLDVAHDYAMPLSEEIYNTSVGVVGRDGNWQAAIKLLAEMQTKGFEPNMATYNACIISAKEAGKESVVQELLAEMRAKGLQPDLMAYGMAELGEGKK